MNKTEKKILDAAFEVLAQDFSAPLEKVAEAAGVTRMTLHRYFNGREALIEASGLEIMRLGNQIIDDALAQHDHPYYQLKAIILEAAQMGERIHFLMHAQEEIDQALFSPLVQALDDKMIRIFDALREENLLEASMPNAWLLHLYGGIMTAAWSSLREGAVARKEIPALAWRSFANGVLINHDQL